MSKKTNSSIILVAGIVIIVGLTTFAIMGKEEKSNKLNNPDSIVTAAQVIEDYKSNEIAAKTKYEGKSVQISGEVKEIGESAIGSGSVIELLVSKSTLNNNPRLNFDESKSKEIASLKKGQVITAVCIGNGTSLNAPIFNDCLLK